MRKCCDKGNTKLSKIQKKNALNYELLYKYFYKSPKRPVLGYLTCYFAIQRHDFFFVNILLR